MSDTNNKINFYLIKDGLALDDIFKDAPNTLGKVTVKAGFDLYYNKKPVIIAPWVQNFFKQELKDINNHHIFNAASSQAVLIRSINIRQKDVTFAICFGTGYHLLKKDAFEPRFGLLAVLNIVGENSLRKIDKHDISGTPKFTAEQLAKKGSQLDFGLDIELDILLGVTGALDKDLKRESRLHGLFGTTLSGKSNLNINSKFDVDNVDKLLKASYAAYRAKRYEKKGFGWIDKIELIKKKTTKHTELLTKLDECLATPGQNTKIWFAVPELVEWENIQGFYFANNRQKVFEDVSRTALTSVVTETPLTTAKLHSTKVCALHADGSKNAYEWSAYDCLYAEVELNGESYILINSEWYKLKGDFVTETNAKYQNIIQNHTSQITFKDYESVDGNENGYNTNMTTQIANAVCLDAQNISHGGKQSKIEFCDIFDRDNKNIIHIKKYSGSSVLSHLFAQGYVSAQLLLHDKGFRTKVEEKIHQISNAAHAFGDDIDGYNVVFGIIAKPNTTDIPLFSKINLNNIFMRIQAMKGLNASIAFIPNQAQLMNMFLHNIGEIDGDASVSPNDALVAASYQTYDYVLANPPFGKKSSMSFTNEEGEQEADDLTYNRQDFWATTSNKQLNFVQHIRTMLKTTGKAAVVVPDNVLFEGGAGETIRRKLLENTDLHTILRLPTGIFYANGVKANVIFFDNRKASKETWTKEVWYYDYRTNIHHTLKKKTMRLDDLREFIDCYNPENRHVRKETWDAKKNPEGRWRKYSYEELIARDKTSLDLFWLKDRSLSDLDNLPEPDELASEIIDNLEAGLNSFREILGALGKAA